MTKILCGIVITFTVLIVVLCILPLETMSHTLRWHHLVLIFLFYGSALCALLLMPKTNGVGRLFAALYACLVGYIGTGLLRSAFISRPNAQLNVTKVSLRFLNTAIQSYKVDYRDRLPQSLDELIPYLPTKNFLKDAFGQDFIYLPDFEHGTYKLLSIGKDGLQGTKDDITN